MSYAHHKLLTWCLPHLLLLPLTYLWLLALPTGVSANHCRVTGGVLGIHWSSIISLGWYPLAEGRAGARCWEFCCLEPKCNAVWSLGGRCVFLSCSREGGCPISILPQPHAESLGLLQLLSKVPVSMRRRAIRRAPPTGSHRIHKRPHIRSGSSNTEAAHPAPSTIALIQVSQKNISQITNGSSGTPPAPSPQNSTINVTLDAAVSSSNVSTPTAASSTINTTPTQADEIIVLCGCEAE